MRQMLTACFKTLCCGKLLYIVTCMIQLVSLDFTKQLILLADAKRLCIALCTGSGSGMPLWMQVTLTCLSVSCYRVLRCAIYNPVCKPWHAVCTAVCGRTCDLSRGKGSCLPPALDIWTAFEMRCENDPASAKPLPELFLHHINPAVSSSVSHMIQCIVTPL